jgi:hypothetical protein
MKTIKFKDHPCKNCLIYPICYSRLIDDLSHYYIPTLAASIRVSFVNTLIFKCEIIDRYLHTSWNKRYKKIGEKMTFEEYTVCLVKDAFDLSNVKGSLNNDIIDKEFL